MNIRYKIFIGIIFLFFTLWTVYLFAVQLLDPHHLKKTVEIRQNPFKEIITPYRGKIYDRNKNLLVSSVKYFQIDFDRRQVHKMCKKNSDLKISEIYREIADIISKNTDIPKDKILKKLNLNSTGNNVQISRNITESELIAIKTELSEKRISGLVSTFNNIKRTYPHGKLAARLLGFVRKKNDKIRNNLNGQKGICGLEATYDDVLAGTYGWKEVIHDANNKKIPFLFLKKREPKNGNSLVLTLDCNYQEILEENLQKAIEKYKAKNAIGLVMNIRTGEILAMSGISNKEKNLSASSLRAMQNLPVSFMFEPGSTFKPITALLALEKKIYAPTDKIDCRDYHIDGRTITDAHEHGYKFLNFRDIIAHSSNVGISKIVEKIGSKTLYERIIEMGFGHKTGSNLYGEAKGILRKLKNWQGYSLHSISFGQEISVTALQLGVAYCAFANGGHILRPYIVKEIIDDKGDPVEEYSPKILRTISDKQSLDTLKVFLKSVVDYGTATATKLDYLTIAGKTGTAEKALKSGGYSKDKYTAVFAGFFPVDNPEYTIIVALDEPQYEDYYYYASMSAVPTFKNIVLNMISLPENNLIVEEKLRKLDYLQMPDFIGLTKEKTINLLERKGIKYNFVERVAGGIVVNQYPKAGVNFADDETVQIIIGQKTIGETDSATDDKMPNLRGMTLRKAIAQTNKHNLKPLIEGIGTVYWQSVPVGEKIEYGQLCRMKAK